MRSSNAHLPLRLELRPSQLRGWTLSALAALAVLALGMSGLPWPTLLAVVAVTAFLLAREFSRPRPVRLRVSADNVLWLDWPDAAETVAELRSSRRLGGWLVLRLQVHGSTLWLDCWPDAFSIVDRKALLRRLQGGLPSASPV